LYQENIAVLQESADFYGSVMYIKISNIKEKKESFVLMWVDMSFVT